MGTKSAKADREGFREPDKLVLRRSDCGVLRELVYDQSRSILTIVEEYGGAERRASYPLSSSDREKLARALGG